MSRMKSQFTTGLGGSPNFGTPHAHLMLLSWTWYYIFQCSYSLIFGNFLWIVIIQKRIEVSCGFANCMMPWMWQIKVITLEPHQPLTISGQNAFFFLTNGQNVYWKLWPGRLNKWRGQLSNPQKILSSLANECKREFGCPILSRMLAYFSPNNFFWTP